MGNRFEISVVGNNPDWADERINEATAEINRVEKLLSAFTDDSIVNAINKNAGIKPVRVTAEIFRLIERSVAISALTHGAFDITYAVTEKDLAEPAVAVKNTSKTALKRVNYHDIELNAKECTVFLTKEGMRIGFSANSKGYAADRAKLLLQMNGVSSGVINAAGDLLTWGLNPENEPWTIATADPTQKNNLFAHLNISNMAVATSVNTGKSPAAMLSSATRNGHLSQGFQVSGIRSASIVSPSAELSDALATPMVSIGINAGLYLINQLNQVACVMIDDHERLYTSRDISINL